MDSRKQFSVVQKEVRCFTDSKALLSSPFSTWRFLWFKQEKSNLIGCHQILTTSPPNHIRYLPVRSREKIARWKTGFDQLKFWAWFPYAKNFRMTLRTSARANSPWCNLFPMHKEVYLQKEIHKSYTAKEMYQMQATWNTMLTLLCLCPRPFDTTCQCKRCETKFTTGNNKCYFDASSTD